MKPTTVAIVCVVASVTVSLAALAASNRRPLQGTLEVRGATIVDPPPDEPTDTHAAFVIKGEAAQLLYESMKVQPIKDECLADGSLAKRLGNLKCIRLAKDAGYECDFAINIKEQTIELGRVC